MARSWAETAYHDGTACQAPGPDGLPKMTRLFISRVSFPAAARLGGDDVALPGKPCVNTRRPG
jgi:hypothetical protein